MGGCTSAAAASQAYEPERKSPEGAQEDVPIEIAELLGQDMPRAISKKLEAWQGPEKWLKASLWYSQTDEGGADTESFTAKAYGQSGAVTDCAQLGLGFICMKGQKSEGHEHPNQDSWLVLKVENDFSFYAVFDGHGTFGHDVSNYVKDYLPSIILSDKRFRGAGFKEALRDSFVKMQAMLRAATEREEIDAEKSGTTVTVAVHDLTQQKLTVAHVGDSGACLARIHRHGTTKDLEAFALTKDHTPEDKHEKARVEKGGGRVDFDGNCKYRVYARDQTYPGLAMSRCLGDLRGHREAGLSCQPDVSEHQITADDLMLLLCSDGIWEWTKPQEAVEYFREALPGLCPFQGARRLQHWHHKAPPSLIRCVESMAHESRDLWLKEVDSVDDITVVAAMLRPLPARPQPAAHELTASSPRAVATTMQEIAKAEAAPQVVKPRLIESL